MQWQIQYILLIANFIQWFAIFFVMIIFNNFN